MPGPVVAGVPALRVAPLGHRTLTADRPLDQRLPHPVVGDPGALEAQPLLEALDGSFGLGAEDPVGLRAQQSHPAQPVLQLVDVLDVVRVGVHVAAAGDLASERRLHRPLHARRLGRSGQHHRAAQSQGESGDDAAHPSPPAVRVARDRGSPPVPARVLGRLLVRQGSASIPSWPSPAFPRSVRPTAHPSVWCARTGYECGHPS